MIEPEDRGNLFGQSLRWLLQARADFGLAVRRERRECDAQGRRRTGRPEQNRVEFQKARTRFRF